MIGKKKYCVKQEKALKRCILTYFVLKKIDIFLEKKSQMMNMIFLQ